MKSQNNSGFAKFGLHILALSLCVLPPALATLFYFPIWKMRGGVALLSGGVILLIALSALPIMKFLAQKIRSAASWVRWSFIFLAFFLLGRIADEMTVISFFGVIGNLLVAFVFKIAKRGEENGQK